MSKRTHHCTPCGTCFPFFFPIHIGPILASPIILPGPPQPRAPLLSGGAVGLYTIMYLRLPTQ